MGRALRSPGEAGGVSAAAKKEALAHKIIANSTDKLAKRLKHAMTTQEFFDSYDNIVKKAENRFEYWGEKGLVEKLGASGATLGGEKLNSALIEKLILEGAQDKVANALGEAMALRIGYAYRRLIWNVRVTGGRFGKDLSTFVEKLAKGHGDVEKLLRDSTMKISDPEQILDTLSEKEIKIINWASKAKVVNKVVKIPEPLFEPGVIRGTLRWSVRKMLDTKVVKGSWMNLLKIRGIIQKPAEHAATLEAFGVYLDKNPTLRKVVNAPRLGHVAGLLIGGYLLHGCLSSNESEVSEGTKRAGAKKEAKNKEVQGILWGATHAGRMDPYLKNNSVVIANLIDTASVEDTVKAADGGVGVGQRALTQVEKKRIADILVAYTTSTTVPDEKKKAFMEKANKKAIIEILAVLTQLKTKGKKAQVGELAVDIAMGVAPDQRVAFAWDLINSKRAKAGDIRYFYENPPAKYKMTMEWLGRPFDVFSKTKFTLGGKRFTGFTPNDNLKMLCAAIRAWGRNVPESEKQISESQMETLAEAMANVYALMAEKKRVRPTVPDEFQGHLKFATGLVEKGFSIAKAATVLYALEYSYYEKYSKEERFGGMVFDPLQDDKGRKDVMDKLIPQLNPNMSEEDLYYQTQALAYLETGLGSKEFMRELNPNLKATFGPKVAGMLAMDPRLGFAKGTQSMELAKESGEVFRALSRIWKSNKPRYSDQKILAFGTYVITAALSKNLDRHFSETEKGEILYTILSETGEADYVKLNVSIPSSKKDEVGPRMLPLSVNINSKAVSKQSRKDKKMLATLRALAIRHVESFVARKKSVTLQAVQDEVKLYMDFVRTKYVGRKYTTFDKIETAFAKHKARVEKSNK
ncbi:MAG: hypothetical protein GY852_11120 [bacterium]|nr:hypothetical protein [bacterium]